MQASFECAYFSDAGICFAESLKFTICTHLNIQWQQVSKKIQNSKKLKPHFFCQICGAGMVHSEESHAFGISSMQVVPGCVICFWYRKSACIQDIFGMILIWLLSDRNHTDDGQIRVSEWSCQCWSKNFKLLSTGHHIQTFSSGISHYLDRTILYMTSFP